MKEELVK